MTQIHPSSVVEPGAKLGAGVKIGPFCTVGAQVELGDGVELISHVAVAGITTIDAGTRIFPFASIGHQPQDLKYHGEPSKLTIGKNNQIREGVTLNPGTEGGGMLTSVGDNCLLMAGVHVAHDCHLGNHVIMANNATLAGHIVVGDFAFVGGLAAVHQFCRIGKHAMIGGMSGVEQDVIPYGMVIGNRAHLSGLNLVGLKRRGFEREEIHKLRAAYRMLFADEGTLAERIEDVAQLFTAVGLVQEVVDFTRNASSRGICLPLPDGTKA
ncbi:acyl-ACP--UDP-N-acetylglucosamine O-acyltransferase [Ferrovibrio sp. MS7]|uniref:acyl-ACP--UDP-N-acetylglucosamine O-acyltransferase n=1 Tax=Ferrovibrio plantarum TaxID=3119164 RepID=UPI001B5FFA34|nr:acyl-ACP--UDP-N-acetylglucosamine O-acyltransferase [Ferrovibrio sp.]